MVNLFMAYIMFRENKVKPLKLNLVPRMSDEEVEVNSFISDETTTLESFIELLENVEKDDPLSAKMMCLFIEYKEARSTITTEDQQRDTLLSDPMSRLERIQELNETQDVSQDVSQ